MQQHRRLDAKAGGEDKTIAEGLKPPAQAASRIALGQGLGDQLGIEGGIQVRLAAPL